MIERMAGDWANSRALCSAHSWPAYGANPRRRLPLSLPVKAVYMFDCMMLPIPHIGRFLAPVVSNIDVNSSTMGNVPDDGILRGGMKRFSSPNSTSTASWSRVYRLAHVVSTATYHRSQDPQHAHGFRQLAVPH